MTPTPSITKQKELFREKLKSKRNAIPAYERKKSSTLLFEALRRITKRYTLVLSFASFSTEIDTWALNHHLATEGKLLLPCVVILKRVWSVGISHLI